MTLSESERRTRKNRIAPRLRQAGWAAIAPFELQLNVFMVDFNAGLAARRPQIAISAEFHLECSRTTEVSA